MNLLHRARRLNRLAGLGFGLSLALAPLSASASIAVGPYIPSSTSAFVVPIVVSGATALDAFAFDLAYDASAYAINTGCDPFSDGFCDLVTGPVTLGTFYSGASVFASLFNPGFILLDGLLRQTGSLVGVNGAWQDPGPAPSGDGVLAFVEFIALREGAPTSPIMVVGSPPASVPEPPTVALLFAALAAATAGRARRSGATVATVTVTCVHASD